MDNPYATEADPRQITLDLGGRWHGHSGNAACPVCQSERRRNQSGLSITAKGGKLLLHCHKSGCDFRDILDAIGLPRTGADVSPAAQAKFDREIAADAEKKRLRARKIWDYAEPIAGTHGERYFRERGITFPLPASLRWRADLMHPSSGQWLSAIVADVQPTGGAHRTFFQKSGERLASAAKLMLGPCAGGAVRLADGGGPLIVGEGVESTLSYLQLQDRPNASAWATLSTSGMRGIKLPRAPGDLIIAVDGDAPGRSAGRDLAERASNMGWQVSIADPGDGLDWNDVLQAEGAGR